MSRRFKGLKQRPSSALNMDTQAELVAALLRTVFAQDSRAECHQQWRLVADQLREKYPKIAALMDGCEDEVLAHMAFPKAHRQQLHGTNPLERFNAEIKGHDLETNLFGLTRPLQLTREQRNLSFRTNDESNQI